MEHKQSEWAYELPPEKLMELFWQNLARAAVNGSGLVINLGGGNERQEAVYLYGVILSRLEGASPPFGPGDKVRIRPEETYYCGSVNHTGSHYMHGKAEPGTEYEVSRIFYEKFRRASYEPEKYDWSLTFRGHPEYRFGAHRFEKVGQKEPAAA